MDHYLKFDTYIYKLAGVTLKRGTHYCAVVLFEKRPYRHDGLVGELRNIPHDIEFGWLVALGLTAL